MSRIPSTLIYDIGKTTKKIVVFDTDFHVLEEQAINFNEVKDDDGFPVEDIEAVTGWVTDTLDQYIQDSKYEITHINFSAYGASLVHLAPNGRIITPFVNYLKPLPEGCKTKFFGRHDSQGSISRTTASPFLGLLNSGLQLYWLKHYKPEVFHGIATSLHFPQYFSYLLTGKKFSDITSVGCHTMLWDFERHDYHQWVHDEGLTKLFPSIHNADKTTDQMLSGSTLKVGVGVHDSSAALMPYLVVMKEPFLLLSTGTWNICFNPFTQEHLTQEQLSQDCLCYMTFDGKPVKASRIFLGNEHEHQQRLLSSHFKVGPEAYKKITFDEKLYNGIAAANGFVNFAPIGMAGTGPLLKASPASTDFSKFKTFDEAQHHLIRQLVRWQQISIDLLDPGRAVKNIILVGGFTKSNLFLQIMKRELTDRHFLTSDHPRAEALGAAWLVRGRNSYADKSSLLNVTRA